MADKEKQPFDFDADPFNTGFELREEITTDEVINFVTDRRSFIPKDEPFSDPIWWKANAKAAIKNGWFKVPDWKPNDVGKWPLAQTRWVSELVIAHYERMAEVPFLS